MVSFVTNFPGSSSAFSFGFSASFVVPGDPKAAPGSPAYEHGSQVANLKNLSVPVILAKIPMQRQNRYYPIRQFGTKEFTLNFTDALFQS